MWTGPIEHIFFHPLVVRPELAFTEDAQGQGFRDYFVTVHEFKRILPELYRNGYALVDIRSAARGRLRMPVGKKPLVISVDDLNYNEYMRRAGTGWRLVVAPDGRVAVELRTPDGGEPRISRDDEIIPLLDDFVGRHPDFSVRGARGLIALTGYEGVFGERTNLTGHGSATRRQRARLVAAKLRASGWRFASHSWGHINTTTSSLERIRGDANRWRDQVEPIVGRTNVYILPFGARTSASATALLRDEFGFRIFCDIDSHPVLLRAGGVVRMARRHIDGLAFEGQRRNLAHLFRVGRVIDRAARRSGPYSVARSTPSISAGPTGRGATARRRCCFIAPSTIAGRSDSS